MRFYALVIALAAVTVSTAYAVEPEHAAPCAVAVESCSGMALPEAPAPALLRGYGKERPVAEEAGNRPFSAFAVAVKVGVGGIGIDVATPINRRLNLRGGGEFFSTSANFLTDGINTTGTLNLRSGRVNLDVFPFAGRFRISPGLTFYNGNHISAVANVPGGQQFDLGDDTYTSSPTDPVHGSFDLNFGNKVAPSLTVGFGNMIPRHGGHFSVPFEIGFEYISPPTTVLTLGGSACQQGVCQPIASDPDTQANVQQEQAQINSDIKPLRFFPIASVGLGYRF